MAKNKNLIAALLWLVTFSCAFGQGSVRQKVVESYSSQIGVRELTGNNDGKEVEMYLKSVGLGKGYAWCAAFVCWSIQQGGIYSPKSAWSPAMFPNSRVKWRRNQPGRYQPLQGDVFGLYYANLKRVGHVGFVDRWGDKEVHTVEGNTNQAGSREGDGVYRKIRLTRQIYIISNLVD
jgi:hypothetical protein